MGRHLLALGAIVFAAVLDGLDGQAREERAAAYRAAQSMIVADLPRIHLIYHVNHHGYRTRWSGWSWAPEVRGTVPFWSLERITRSAG